MYKVWTISLCYTDADIIRDSLKRLQETRTPEKVDMQIVMIDQHWPINYETHRKELEIISAENNAILLDPGKNLGLHDGFNWALEQLPIPDNAMVIGYDPDSHPDTVGWDKAMCDVFVADSKVMWLSLWHQHSTRELIEEGKGSRPMQTGGHWIRQLTRAAMNSVSGFRRGWLRQVGGLKEPSRWYGGLEVAMWGAVVNHGKWVFLQDFKESPVFYDRMNPLYRTWKWRHAHEGYPHDFAFFISHNTT